jgi:hypothetical protein
MRPNFEPQKEHRLVMAHLLRVPGICEKSAGRLDALALLLWDLRRVSAPNAGTLPGAGRKRFVANCKGLLQKEVLLFVKNASHPAATGVAGHWRNLEHVARAGILAPRRMAAHIADAPLAKVPGRRLREQTGDHRGVLWAWWLSTRILPAGRFG